MVNSISCHDLCDINGNTSSNNLASIDDLEEDETINKTINSEILQKFKDAVEYEGEKCTLFDIGLEYPVFIIIRGNYYFYGIDETGNVVKIESFIRGMHSDQYWLKEGTSTLICCMAWEGYTSETCYDIKGDLSVVKEYEIRNYLVYNDKGEIIRDSNGDVIFEKKIYLNEIEQKFLPEEYEGYIQVDDTMTEIVDLFE